MTADESLTGGRRGRRARAMEAETGGRRRGGTGVLLVRRASVELPAFDSPMPVMERFEARTLEANRPFIHGAAGESTALPTTQPTATAADAPTPGAADPSADEATPKKKSGWSLFGRKKPVVAPNANVDVLGAETAVDAAEPDYDIEAANATDTTTFDLSDIDQYEQGLDNQTTEEAVDSVAAEPEHDEHAEEALIDAVSDEAEERESVDHDSDGLPDNPDAADASSDDDNVDADSSSRDGVGDGEPAGFIYDPDAIPRAENGPADLELGAEDPALEPVEGDQHDAEPAPLQDEPGAIAQSAQLDETSTDMWTSPPLTIDRDLDGVEFGELARDSAPDPRPAPRFTGTVLNKPARTGAGVGAWVTWILVVVVLLVLIMLLVFGVIGPGVIDVAVESPGHVLSALSPPALL